MTVTPIQNPRADVLQERSLAAIFFKAAPLVGKKIDYVPPIGIALACLVVCPLAEYRLHALADAARQLKMLTVWSTNGLLASVTILGFLIAGFSVFATLSDKELFRRLASYKSDKPISSFKFIFFSFIYTFVVYIAFVITSACIMVLAEENSPVQYLLSFWEARQPDSERVGVAIVTSIYLAYMLHVLLVLRGFVWNLYSSLLIAIFWQSPDPPKP